MSANNLIYKALWGGGERVRLFASFILRAFTPFIVEVAYKGFWNFREKNKSKIKKNRFFNRIYSTYMLRMGCYIGESTLMKSLPVLPHGMNGVFISNMAVIGENVTIFQHVTIGSNTLKNHPKAGAPVIGNNVYIGAGAKIIGKVKIGDNCRIGANCVVVKDMSPNTTAIAAATRFIENKEKLDNTFLTASQFLGL